MKKLRKPVDLAREGFSLLEVLVATAVLSFGVLGMAQLFLLSIQTNRRAAQNTQSSNLLQHRLEQLRQLDFCLLRNAANVNWMEDAPIGSENMGKNAGDPKVFAGREAKYVGTGANVDWVIERRILSNCAASGGITEIDKQPVDEVVLIELRGYRKGVRSEGLKKKWIYMSAYRTPRVSGSCVPPIC